MQSLLRERRFVETILPVTRWKVELASFDIYKITNPAVQRADYQEDDQKNYYNTKAYGLHRDGYRCDCFERLLSGGGIDLRSTRRTTAVIAARCISRAGLAAKRLRYKPIRHVLGDAQSRLTLVSSLTQRRTKCAVRSRASASIHRPEESNFQGIAQGKAFLDADEPY